MIVTDFTGRHCSFPEVIVHFFQQVMPEDGNGDHDGPNNARPDAQGKKQSHTRSLHSLEATEGTGQFS